MGYVSLIVRTGGRVTSNVSEACTVVGPNSANRFSFELTSGIEHESTTSGSASTLTRRAEPWLDLRPTIRPAVEKQNIPAAIAAAANIAVLRLLLPMRIQTLSSALGHHRTGPGSFQRRSRPEHPHRETCS